MSERTRAPHEAGPSGASEPGGPSSSGASRPPAQPPVRGAHREQAHPGHGHHGSYTTLLVGAIGVVYGDIGTSPLYALRECFHHSTGIHATHDDVLGLLSLFFWSLMLVVTLKYVLVLTRADNHGEGGILALLALVLPKRRAGIGGLALLGMFGACLLYADGVLTPAISVTSAVEGTTGIRALADLGIERFVVPISAVILVTLFAAQRRGTAKVGAFFGPIMLLWFALLAGTGIYWIAQHPGVLWALSPEHAIRFFLRNGLTGYWVLGSVVLCITGGEALYADMGHFGRGPISGAWRLVVLPALLLNYFGQGALLLEHPHLVEDSFFAMVGYGSARAPLVLIATMATVVASQALISGAFSLTRQAIQLGYLPRLDIRHTSSETEGQIYIPEVNWALAGACVVLVASLRSSSNMAAAYGIAVTGTMLITTALFFVLARRWWGDARAVVVCGLFALLDGAFLLANVRKIESGGWIPLVIAFVLLAAMTTWKIGRDRVAKFLRDRSIPLEEFFHEVERKNPPRVPGSAVFMTSTLNGTPPVLRHHFKHTHTLHEQVVLLSIVTEDVPFVARSERVTVEPLEGPPGFFRVTAHYGFMQSARVTDVLRACEAEGLRTRQDATSYFLGREKLVITKNAGMAGWRKHLFALLSRNARPATDYFRLPPDRVVEMGMALEL